MAKKIPYYNDYLEVSKIITLGNLATNEHDEQLFMTIHQAYELWFRHIIFELKSVINFFVDEESHKPRRIDDNSGEMVLIVSRLSRIVEIWKVLVAQIDILETMTPMDFLEFRKSLSPASGFQSKQFRMIEALLGLTAGARYKSTDSVDKGADYYKKVGAAQGGFDDDDRREIDQIEKSANLRFGVIAWLSRFAEAFGLDNEKKYHDMWQEYLSEYRSSLPEQDQEMLTEQFNDNFLAKESPQSSSDFTNSARRAALIISLLRDYPVLRAPFQVITRLIDIDEYMAIWRFRHLNMAVRMIGKRSGTGGHSSKYLEGAVRDNRVFPELLELPTYLLDTSSVEKIISPYKDVLLKEFSLKKHS